MALSSTLSVAACSILVCKVLCCVADISEKWPFNVDQNKATKRSNHCISSNSEDISCLDIHRFSLCYIYTPSNLNRWPEELVLHSRCPLKCFASLKVAGCGINALRPSVLEIFNLQSGQSSSSPAAP